MLCLTVWYNYPLCSYNFVMSNNGEVYETDCFWCGTNYNPLVDVCPLCASNILTGPIEIVKYKEETESDGVE